MVYVTLPLQLSSEYMRKTVDILCDKLQLNGEKVSGVDTERCGSKIFKPDLLLHLLCRMFERKI